MITVSSNSIPTNCFVLLQYNLLISVAMSSLALNLASLLLSLVLLKELFSSFLFIESRSVIPITLFSTNDPVINSNDWGQREKQIPVLSLPSFATLEKNRCS